MPVEEGSREASEEERVGVNLSRDKVGGSPQFDPDEVPDLDIQTPFIDHYDCPTPRGAVLRRTLENR